MNNRNRTLFINACVRPESRTLVLARRVLEEIGDACDEVNVVDGNFAPLDRRALDLRTEKVRSGDFADASFDPAKRFAQAETVVIAAPFWDLSFPSFLKIYFENILTAGLTFTYADGRPKGLCRAKKLYYVTTAGGAIAPDFGFAYVRAIAENFLGIPEVKCFSAEGLDIIGNDVDRIMRDAAEKIHREMQCR